MKRVIIACALLLAGCADRLAVAPIEIAQQDVFISDTAQCQAAAAAWQPQTTAGTIIYGAISQGLSVISYAVLYPWMPVLGGVGGAGKAAADGFDITGRIRANVFRHCMADKVARDHSAIIANPDD